MASVHGPQIPRHPSPFRRAYKPHKLAHQAPQPTAPPASASSSSDPYYGHEETAKICARFVTHIFTCPDLPPPPSAAAAAASSSVVPPPAPTLAHFIAYALHRTRLHASVTFTALALLQRLKSRFPAARGSSGHRLFLSAFMIASKVVCDDTYSNKSWAVVGQGMFALREINQMEREMCAYLEWQLNVPPDALRRFEADARAAYARPPPYAPAALARLQLCIAPPEKDTPQQLPTPTDVGLTQMPFSMHRADSAASISSAPPAISPVKPHAAYGYYPSPPTTPPSPLSASSVSTSAPGSARTSPALSSPASDAPPATPPTETHTVHVVGAHAGRHAPHNPLQPYGGRGLARGTGTIEGHPDALGAEPLPPAEAKPGRSAAFVKTYTVECTW